MSFAKNIFFSERQEKKDYKEQIIKSLKPKKILFCPICNYIGEDLIVCFYCINPRCKNFYENQ